MAKISTEKLIRQLLILIHDELEGSVQFNNILDECNKRLKISS